MNAGGEPLRELDLQAQSVRFDGIEGGAIVAIAFAAVAARVAHWFPLAVRAVKQLPRLGQAAFADTGVVEPIDLHGTHARRFGELVLHPFLRALVGPPMKKSVGVIAGTLRFALVVERARVRPHAIGRGRGFAGGGDGGVRQRTGARLVAGQPDGHLAAAAIRPGVIGNGSEWDLVLFEVSLRVGVAQAHRFAPHRLHAVEQVRAEFGGQGASSGSRRLTTWPSFTSGHSRQ